MQPYYSVTNMKLAAVFALIYDVYRSHASILISHTQHLIRFLCLDDLYICL